MALLRVIERDGARIECEARVHPEPGLSAPGLRAGSALVGSTRGTKRTDGDQRRRNARRRATIIRIPFRGSQQTDHHPPAAHPPDVSSGTTLRPSHLDVESIVSSKGGVGLRSARPGCGGVATRAAVDRRGPRCALAPGRVRPVTPHDKWSSASPLHRPRVLSAPCRWGSSGREGTTTSRFRWRTEWRRHARPHRT